MSLYREAEGGTKDGRKGLLVRSNSKKTSKKVQNRLVGFVTLPVTKVCTRNPAQTWLTLQPPANADSMNPVLLSPSEISGSGSAVSTNFISSSSASNVNGGTGVQLRVSVRYKSVDVLPISAYLPLHTLLLQPNTSLNCSISTAVCKSLPPHSRMCADDSPRTPVQDGSRSRLVRENGLEFTEWFEQLIPLKLKEEVASCFVNLHERSGTAASFLTELVVREVSSLENDSMTFRSNTMATKAVESYIKLVGKEYLHNLLYRYIQRVLICSETWEVDPDKLLSSSLASGTLLAPDGQGTSTPAALIIQEYCTKKRMPAGSCEQSTPGSGLSLLATLSSGRVAQPGSLVYSQTQLLQHLDLVWNSICASLPSFPKPLLEVFSSFRAVLEPSKGAEFCDKLISACIFLRFVCPAILTPSLFGLASTFPGESNCQRNLTLVAKSLQSLANLSTFGDKESFMRFMNAYVEAQIPVMRSFLRDISSLPGVPEPRKRGLSPVAGNIDCGYELACLQNICLELFSTSKDQQKPPNTFEIFTTSNGNSPISSLPPSLTCLPEIVFHLENLKNGSSLGTDLTDTRATFDLAYTSVDSSKRFPAPTAPYVATTSTRNELKKPLSQFYLSMEESVSDLSPNTGIHYPFPETNNIVSSIRKPRPVRPTTVRIPTTLPSNQQLPQHQSSCTDPLMTSPKRVASFEEEEDDRVTLKEILRASAFTCDPEPSCGGTSAKATSHENDVDYDDPCTDDAYDSTQAPRRRTIYDAPYEELGVVRLRAVIAFSLYRRPLATKLTSSDIPFTNSPPMECATSPVTVPPTTPTSSTSYGVSSSTTATVAAGPRTSPRRSNPYKTALAGAPLKTSLTCAANSPTSDILVLKPRPNLVITHLKPHPSRSSTASSSSRSSLKNRQELIAQQHHYPYRQVVNAGLASCASGVTTTATASAAGTRMSPGQTMSSSVDSTLFQIDYHLGNDSATGETGSCWASEATCGVDGRGVLSTRRINGFTDSRSHPPPSQPVLTENEQLLTSTLEELGDAVAWLERERIDLLNVQGRRQSNSRPRSRLGNSSSFCPLSLPRKNPVLNIQTSTASRASPTPSNTKHQRPHPHTSTPSLHWLNYPPSPTDEISSLAKSTNSLTEHTLVQHRNQRSAVSKTITLTRSGSSSVSPSRRSRDSSDSSDNTSGFQTRRQRTATLVLASKATPASNDGNGANRLSSQTPIVTRRVPNKGSNSEELDLIVLHPYRPRPHPNSFISTSNCNLLRSNNPPTSSTYTAAAAIAVAGGDAARPRQRDTGGVFVLSSSPLTS
ncbi:Ras GTPase-activating protein raskol [Taenia crassiceps]|uniref:Ras GTPase-activating protein raskol n=1 Tax=Taenia crassiceps TaxID=6207 RepID=A0ABR4QPV5_9CEST